MEKIRTTIVWAAACIAFVAGVGLCIAGFTVPPKGEISGSVLTALGEFLSFFGAIFGIGSYTKLQILKIEKNEKH